MTEIQEQAMLCNLMGKRLAGAAMLHEDKGRYHPDLVSKGASHTQIKADIARLRRELLILGDMIDKVG